MGFHKKNSILGRSINLDQFCTFTAATEISTLLCFDCNTREYFQEKQQRQQQKNTTIYGCGSIGINSFLLLLLKMLTEQQQKPRESTNSTKNMAKTYFPKKGLKEEFRLFFDFVAIFFLLAIELKYRISLKSWLRRKKFFFYKLTLKINIYSIEKKNKSKFWKVSLFVKSNFTFL